MRDRLPGGSDEVRVVRRWNTEQPLRERELEGGGEEISERQSEEGITHL